MFSHDNPIRVIFGLSDLASCLPQELIERMARMDDGPNAIVQHEGVQFFIHPPAYRGQQRMFYVLATLDHELPEQLHNLRCKVEFEGYTSGPVNGIEAILPQLDEPDYRRPPDYEISVKVQSDTWAGLQRACKALEAVSI